MVLEFGLLLDEYNTYGSPHSSRGPKVGDFPLPILTLAQYATPVSPFPPPHGSSQPSGIKAPTISTQFWNPFPLDKADSVSQHPHATVSSPISTTKAWSASTHLLWLTPSFVTQIANLFSSGSVDSHSQTFSGVRQDSCNPRSFWPPRVRRPRARAATLSALAARLDEAMKNKAETQTENFMTNEQ